MEKIDKMGKFLVLTLLLLPLMLCQSILADYEPLKTGDILLVDMDCWSCQLIEDETFGPYSHSGLVINIGDKTYIGQSLEKVYLLELKYFKNFSTKPLMHLRPKAMNEKGRKKLIHRYQTYYDGIAFDHDFEWGDDSLYCSEFIYKLLDDVLDFENFLPRPMEYGRNWQAWRQYFRKDPPQGELGISPNDFFRSSEFQFIQYID